MSHCLQLLPLSSLRLGDGFVILNYGLRPGCGLVLNHGLRFRLPLNNRPGFRSGLMMHYRLGPRCLVMMHYYMLRCRFVMNNHRLVCYYYRLIS